MLSWEKDRPEIVDKIRKNKCSFKLILKTYNDPFFLERWILHHGEVFGYEKIIVADNMSDDPDVLAVYDKYDVFVFSFEQHHNRLHDRADFADFYKALSDSCRHTLLIDTDEFLYFYDGTFVDNKLAPRVITEIPDNASVPCVWIENRPGCGDQFILGLSEKKLIWGVRWGKPIVSTLFKGAGSLIHSEQFPKENFWLDSYSSGVFFLLHFNHLSSSQRIKANMRKLIRTKVIKNNSSLKDVVNMDENIISNKTYRRFLVEIKEAFREGYESSNDSLPLESGYYKLDLNGSVVFFSSEEETLFRTFFKDYDKVIFDDFGACDRASK